jgi:hypothetical protein
LPSPHHKAADAPIVEDEIKGNLGIGDEIQIDRAMWLIYKPAPFEPGREVDFIAVLSAPVVALRLANVDVEIYRGELAKLGPEIARLTDTQGTPAVEALAAIEGVLEDGEALTHLSDEALGIVSQALWAMDVSGDLTERLRAVWHEIRDYLARQRPPT